MDEKNPPAIREDIERLAPQFKAALPAHVSVDKFIRVVLTAVASEPDLGYADRRSLLEAALRCASDGLLPDKNQAAFVVFNTNAAKPNEPARYVKKVQYIRMVGGLLKLVRNSGELETIAARIVFEKDHLEYRLGDDERIIHVPVMRGLRGEPIGAYAIAKMKDGAIYREYMTAEEIAAVRASSKAKDGPAWAGQFFLEMWKKTVLRRLCKRLPMSTDLADRLDADENDSILAEQVESKPVRELREALQDYCERQGGGDPNEMLRQLIGHDSFADLNPDEALRVRKDFEMRYLAADMS